LRAGHIAEALGLCRRFRAGGGHGQAEVSGNAHIWGQLLIPLIQRLEAQWTQDTIEFGHLSLAFINLHRIIGSLAQDMRPTCVMGRGRVLVATLSDEAHLFGTLIVADMLSTAGWATDVLLHADAATLCHRVSTKPYVAVGLSVGHDEGLEGLGDLITDLRACARNGNVQIILGGAALEEPREQYQFLGADLVALSATEALTFLSGSRASVLAS
jgi:methanogenic corrinoid protein MtbC1